jgi:hypothetical protein
MTQLQAGPFLFLRRYAGAKLTDAATLLGLRHPAVTVGPGNCGDYRVIYDRPIPFRFALAFVLSIACFVLPAWADFQTAMDAYNRKDYATALREWQALAEQGEADSQDFLGTLYFKGWGGAAGLHEGTAVVGESRRAGKRECAERSWAALCQRAGRIPGLSPGPHVV